MNKKIDISFDGDSLLLKIEKVTPNEIEIVKAIVGELLNAQEVNDVNSEDADTGVVPESDTNEQISEQSANETHFISCGKYAGYTIADIMGVDAAYIYWMAHKKHKEFCWADVLSNISIWSSKCQTGNFEMLKSVIRTLDLREGTVSIELSICEGIGMKSLDDVKEKEDVEFVREILSEILASIEEDV